MDGQDGQDKDEETGIENERRGAAPQACKEKWNIGGGDVAGRRYCGGAARKIEFAK